MERSDICRTEDTCEMGRLHHVPSEACSSGTAQTSGMTRLAALSGDTVGSKAIWMGETHVAPGIASGPHHHGESETGIYVVSGHPEFIYSDSGREVRVRTKPGDYITSRRSSTTSSPMRTPTKR